MNEELKPNEPRCAPPAADASATCDECGAFGAFVFASMTLCLRCYSERGSCCTEFSKPGLGKNGDSAETSHA